MGITLFFVAAALYVIVGLWFYFRGFHFFRAYNARHNSPDSPRRRMFEPPQSHVLIFFFRSLGVFLMASGLLFLGYMLWRTRH